MPAPHQCICVRSRLTGLPWRYHPNNETAASNLVEHDVKTGSGRSMTKRCFDGKRATISPNRKLLIDNQTIVLRLTDRCHNRAATRRKHPVGEPSVSAR